MTIPTLRELDVLHRNICYALADPKRLQILYALAQEDSHVNGLVDLLEMPQPTVSRHLKILKQRRLVESSRQGSMIVYRLTDDRIISVLDTLRTLMRDLIYDQFDIDTNLTPNSKDEA
jgi:DNA-binding transcriptional ArsR family regulator